MTSGNNYGHISVGGPSLELPPWRARVTSLADRQAAIKLAFRNAGRAWIEEGRKLAKSKEVQIAFTPGNTPRQLFSDSEVLAAAVAGEITLTLTGEVYWCPIVGPGPNH